MFFVVSTIVVWRFLLTNYNRLHVIFWYLRAAFLYDNKRQRVISLPFVLTTCDVVHTDLTSPVSRRRWSLAFRHRSRQISQCHPARVTAVTVVMSTTTPSSTFTASLHALTRMRSGRASSILPDGCAHVHIRLRHRQYRRFRSPPCRWHRTITLRNCGPAHERVSCVVV